MTTRRTLSKKLRFEVFKRDSFRCQYCGAEAPSVLLEVDHIKPIAEGGTDDITNLITSCESCNAGKGARELDDHSVLAKSKAQLDELQERREQLELMMEWKRGLQDLSGDTLNNVLGYFAERVHGWHVSEPSARQTVQKLIKRYGASSVIDAIDAGTDSYLDLGSDGKATKDSANRVFQMLPGICRVNEASKEDPDLREMYYIRGIMRKRYFFVNEWMAMELMKEARAVGISITDLRAIVFDSRNWSQWRQSIEIGIDAYRKKSLAIEVAS